MKVIINADDFGIREDVNESIILAANKLAITSTSIMSNGGSTENALKFARNFKDISYGVHLNITHNEPLSGSDILKNLCFNACPISRKILFFKFQKDLTDAVRNEWRLQIEKCLDNCVKVSHLDSHHHMHTYFNFCKIAVELAEKYKISSIRIGANYITNFAKAPKLIYTNCLNSWLKRTTSLKTTDYFMPLSSFVKCKPDLHCDSVELMCHLDDKSDLTILDCRIIDDILQCKQCRKISFREI